MGEFFRELAKVGLYKRSQGRVSRQVTAAALAVIFMAGCYSLHTVLLSSRGVSGVGGIAYWLPGALLLGFWWVSYRVVNVPAFADFLISVETEMIKVSWPSWSELFRASIVVILFLFAFAGLMFGFDVVFQAVRNILL